MDDYQFLLKQREFVNQDYSESSQLTKNSIGKMYLYFDLEEYISFDNAKYKKFIEISSELDKIDSEIEIQTNLLEYFKEDKELRDKIFAIISEKAKDYVPKIKEIVELLNSSKEEAFKNIAFIKNQMKKYNSR